MPVTVRGATGESARWRATFTLTPEDVRGLHDSPVVIEEGRRGYLAVPEVLVVRVGGTIPYRDGTAVASGDPVVGFAVPEFLGSIGGGLVATDGFTFAPGLTLGSDSFEGFATAEALAEEEGLPLLFGATDDLSDSEGDGLVSVVVEYRVVQLP